jgi:hypothetical protein
MHKFAQGDVHIWSVDTIPTTKEAPDKIIARGETTGHMHQLVGDDTEVFVDEGGNLFAHVKTEATLVHEEHRTVTLPPGKYAFGPTYQYDYDTEETSRVAD